MLRNLMVQKKSKKIATRTHLGDSRFYVPDLSPRDRNFLKKLRPRAIFVAESPHTSEIESDIQSQRRPLCGAAGRQWWGLLTELLEEGQLPDVSLKSLLSFCLQHQMSVMNAVQSPLDPKVSQLFKAADPVKNLGFSKVRGPTSFKKRQKSPSMQAAIESLRVRLCDSTLQEAPIYCLGNDAEWFVRQALQSTDSWHRVKEKIPHPSAWWRQGGLFGKIAREKLSRILGSANAVGS